MTWLYRENHWFCIAEGGTQADCLALYEEWSKRKNSAYGFTYQYR